MEVQVFLEAVHTTTRIEAQPHPDDRVCEVGVKHKSSRQSPRYFRGDNGAITSIQAVSRPIL